MIQAHVSLTQPVDVCLDRGMSRRLFIPRRPPVRRVILLVRDGPYCGICDLWIDFALDGTQDPMAPTEDHILARADGGTNRLDNLQLAHTRCNANKGSLMSLLEAPGWKHGLSKAQQRDVIAWRHRGLTGPSKCERIRA